MREAVSCNIGLKYIFFPYCSRYTSNFPIGEDSVCLISSESMVHKHFNNSTNMQLWYHLGILNKYSVLKEERNATIITEITKVNERWDVINWEGRRSNSTTNLPLYLNAY